MLYWSNLNNLDKECWWGGNAGQAGTLYAELVLSQGPIPSCQTLKEQVRWRERERERKRGRRGKRSNGPPARRDYCDGHLHIKNFKQRGKYQTLQPARSF